VASILIVDDDQRFRGIARRLLESEGFDVVGEADDGEAALAAARELEPDVVLLDVHLPDIDGFEVAERLATKGGPAVVLTSTRDELDGEPVGLAARHSGRKRVGGASLDTRKERLHCSRNPDKEGDMLRKSVVALALLATLVSALVFAGGSLAANGGNAANAKLCQKDGWQALMDSAAAPFSSEGQCVNYGAHGGAIYARASIEVELCASQPFDGICVSTSGFGLKPTTVVTTPLLKNGAAVLTDILIVQADGTVGAPPISFFEFPCVAGNVYSATGSGTSADSLSTPTMPGISITSNTVTRTSACP